MENESYREAVVSVVKDQLHKGSKCSGTRAFLRKKKKKREGKKMTGWVSELVKK